jgi:hypothetical protein
MTYNDYCIYERHCEPEISLQKEIVGTSLFTVAMVSVILFVLTEFIL